MYIHTIDLLRGIAALMVMIVHFAGTGFLEESTITKISAYGQNGVTIFFVISGFIIPYSLIKKNYSLSQFKDFITRRLVRLTPPFHVSLILTILFYYLVPSFSGNYHQNEGLLLSIWKVFINFTYLVPFVNGTWYNDVYWTLAIELQYYLIIGLLYPFITKNKYITLFILIIVCFSHYITDLFSIKLQTSLLDFSTPFVIGIIIFLSKIKFLNVRETILSSVVVFFLCKQQISGTRMIFALVAYLCIFLLQFKSSIATFFGKISYSLYLTHLLLFQVCYVLCEKIIDFSTPTAKEIFVLFLIPLSILFAYGFYKLVEEPAINLSKQLAK